MLQHIQKYLVDPDFRKMPPEQLKQQRRLEAIANKPRVTDRSKTASKLYDMREKVRNLNQSLWQCETNEARERVIAQRDLLNKQVNAISKGVTPHPLGRTVTTLNNYTQHSDYSSSGCNACGGRICRCHL